MESGFHLNVSIAEYLLIAAMYLAIVLPSMLLFALFSRRFRRHFNAVGFVLVLFPILIYAFLEVNFSRQFLNFFYANGILAFCAVGTMIGFVHGQEEKGRIAVLLLLNCLAVILWLVVPRALVRLF